MADEAGFSVTTLTSELVDQAALISMINGLNGLALPVISVQYLPALASKEKGGPHTIKLRPALF
jgi:hypothetical protein